MNKTRRVLAGFLTLVILLGSLGINTFAAAYSFSNLAATNASKKLIDVTCNYYSLFKDNFTVKNNGTVDMIVHVNGCYVATIRPGQSYTDPKSHDFKDRVQVYAKTRGYGNQKIYITATSGKIYKN